MSIRPAARALRQKSIWRRLRLWKAVRFKEKNKKEGMEGRFFHALLAYSISSRFAFPAKICSCSVSESGIFCIRPT